ncbi:bifunctional glycosyltransferase/CDP-glycerol:glycerophosphate glycerophosphotransferase [Pseudalkalibacillus sp. R45]|uniref:bifunctional glycosyltransferase/CDP-glycerol:glycerophosphate glycerophosphotransferase n=1 Tax=Pseudalkalibacillus sp. R45 TaxID=3457433 RepID=UPI003FCC8547
MKKVSIIIPIYNTEEFLDECIYSIIKQKYENFELLLINDGSGLSCTNKINEIAKIDARIKVFHQEERKGVGVARNLGLDKATGDYIYFMDSDDYLGESTIQLLMKNIADHNMVTGKQVRTTLSHESEETAVALDAEVDQDVHLYQQNIKKAFKNRSALHRLISRDLIIERNIRFSEDVDCYADLSFILPLLVESDEVPYVKNAYYFKRKRNDPITNPALMQLDAEKRIKDFITIYNQLKDDYRDNSEATQFLDNHMINFYRKTIVTFLKEERNIEVIYNDLVSFAAKLDQQLLSKKSFIVRRELNPLVRNDRKKYESVNRWHQRLRKVKYALSGRTKLYTQLYRSVYTKLPLKEKTVLFESFLGKNYSDNPKYIYEYMIKNHPDYNFIWIFKEPGKEIPGNPKQIKRFSLKYYYYMGTAKYWVSNSRIPKRFDKREGNVYLQTWHGTPLKKLVFDMKDIHSANPNYKRDVYIQSRRWDYLISPNQYSTEIFGSAFKYDKAMLEYGYPRNDILYTGNDEATINELKRKLNIPVDKKVVLYAPTWRDNDFFEAGKYRFTLQLDLQKMKEQLGDEYVVLLRMHYFIANQLDILEFEGFAFDLSNYEDIAELYLVSDILITDYSSVFFDYANLRRPILFYTYDLESYRDTLRGFYIDIEEDVPGPLLKTTDEVISTIENIEEVENRYKEKYDRFYEKFCSWDDGIASEKVVKEVFKLK